MPTDPPRQLRSVELHVLLSVVDRPRHGYAILQEAEERTDGRPGFEIPTLYRALHRLQSEGLVALVESPSPDQDPRREYYAATGPGREALRDELSRMEIAVAVGRARLRAAGPDGAP